MKAIWKKHSLTIMIGAAVALAFGLVIFLEALALSPNTIPNDSPLRHESRPAI